MLAAAPGPSPVAEAADARVREGAAAGVGEAVPRLAARLDLERALRR
jgi:hypothetical protein